MKTSYWGLVALAGALGCAVDTGGGADAETAGESSEALRKHALTAAQASTALKLIDDICGDTWCEGDHNFRFDQLVCHAGCGGRAGTCKLTFRLFSYDTDVETGPTYTRSCTTPGFTGFESLVQSTGTYQSLVPAYYEALTECIGRVESELREPSTE
jgi:hypothetical protein